MTTPWIISARQDLLWFWVGSLLSLGLGALVLAVPSLALPIFCAWLVCSDGPHFWATWTRSVWDPAERARRGPLIRRSFWIWAPGFLCWGLAHATGVPLIWEIFLFFGALWGYHHAVRQDYGIWALYARKSSLTPTERRLDTWFCYGALWSVFLWFTVAHPLNRAEVGLDLPLWVGPTLGWGFVTTCTLYAAELARRALAGRSVLPGLFLLGPCATLLGIGFVWIGMREPLVAGATNLEQAFAVLAIANGLQHGLQYLGLVAFAAKNRYPDGGPSLAARLSRRAGPAWLFYAALSLPYLGINLLRTAAPGVHIADATVEGLALCVYWGFLLHHYLLDQYIWRPHADGQLRADLGLA